MGHVYHTLFPRLHIGKESGNRRARDHGNWNKTLSDGHDRNTHNLKTAMAVYKMSAMYNIKTVNIPAWKE